MRITSVLRTLVFAAALATALTQAALAGQPEQQAMTNQSIAGSFNGAGIYDAVSSTVGD
ncbi:MAG: hypothetical protein KGI46_10795 [Alphaproteobacteria bacterium]|nr:hypothetical protein [Alphaproteobacteria bacterium]